VLNSAAAKEIEWHCKHYMGRNLMKKFSNGAALAAELGIAVKVLEETFSQYNQGAQQKKDPFGKKYFHNVPFKTNDEFYVSIVTPVVHYCMGGIEIDPDGKVQAPSGPILGVFGAGELCGGVHGANRLGGSSLLGCVVFGRVAGESAARYLLETLIANQGNRATKRLANLAGQLAPHVRVDVEPNQSRINIEVLWTEPSTGVQNHQPPTVTPQASPKAVATPTPDRPKVDSNKEYTLEEVAKHNTEKDCWVIVNGQVLDVTDFLKDHPGGKKAILIYAGRDATAEFNMLHKPDVISKYAPESIIGRVKGATTEH